MCALKNCSGCDACEDWYHGDCIGITRKQSKLIKHYFCDVCSYYLIYKQNFYYCKFSLLQKCKAEDSSLKTIFKTSLGRSDFKEKNDQYVGNKRGKYFNIEYLCRREI